MKGFRVKPVKMLLFAVHSSFTADITNSFGPSYVNDNYVSSSK